MNALRKFMPRRKRIWALLLFSSVFLFALASCGPTKLTITRASLTPRTIVATPALTLPGTSLEEWQSTIKTKLQNDLQKYVYGFLPDSSATKIISHRIVAENAFNGSARIEEYKLIGTANYNGQSRQTPEFNLVVAIPKNADGPVSVIFMESFCPNHNTIPHPDISRDPEGFSCGSSGVMNKTMLFVFGRYIATPPLEMIMEKGYALATMFPSEYVPDRSGVGLEALAALSQGHLDDNTRWGSVAAWAWGFSRAIDVLEQDERFAKDGFVTYGHSRYGKAALVAAAYDERISGVISHQSGTGGASLNKQKHGETVTEITDTYPHWFSKAYANYGGREDDMPIDQHALIALIAPRPIFLGNARRDVWSDPNGAFRAAQGAQQVYKLYNKQGLKQDKLKPFIPGADISFYIRPGTHGVVKEDWPAFLEFMDAHFE